MTKKVFVSGCYVMLHSGHKTINTDQERLYMVKALKTVKEAWINIGSGLMDFEQELRIAS